MNYFLNLSITSDDENFKPIGNSFKVSGNLQEKEALELGDKISRLIIESKILDSIIQA